MIINNTYKFIFIHIPKATGTSITKFFAQFTRWCDLEIGGTSFGENVVPNLRRVWHNFLCLWGLYNE